MTRELGDIRGFRDVHHPAVNPTVAGLGAERCDRRLQHLTAPTEEQQVAAGYEQGYRARSSGTCSATGHDREAAACGRLDVLSLPHAAQASPS